MLRIPFEFFESLLNSQTLDLNWHSNALNAFGMVRIWIQMLRILFEFAFEYFKFGFNVQNLHLNSCRMVRILSNGSNWIRMFRIPLEWFDSLSNGQNLPPNALSPFRMVQIYNQMRRIPFEWLEFGHECFEFLLNGSNLDSNASSPFRMV